MSKVRDVPLAPPEDGARATLHAEIDVPARQGGAGLNTNEFALDSMAGMSHELAG